ncbi:hypothetical protein [Dokdonella sp.]|uniref:hypothetical protein n=1 Tax=Dokdonella sp. TaxID=2291710 RepID=UPI002F427D78
MSRFGKTFSRSFVLLLLPACLFQHWLETHGQSDLLGDWYTVYCSAAWALLGALAFSTVASMLKR